MRQLASTLAVRLRAAVGFLLTFLGRLGNEPGERKGYRIVIA
jgi:hypothetical protein